MKKLISERMGRFDASGIRKVFDLGRSMTDPINFSIGQPDFDVPENVKEAGIAAIRAGKNGYTPTQGIQELHDALRADLKKSYNYAPEATLVTCGVSGALNLFFAATLEPGDEVIFGDPFFVMYKHLVNIFDGKPVIVDTAPDLRLTADKIRPHITDKTKIILVNSPSNPTGVVLTKKELQEIADLAEEKDLFVVADEIYSKFSYDMPFPSMSEVINPERLILMDGLSKSMAMTGWRVGFAAGPKILIENMAKYQQFSFVCAPNFAQHAAIAALSTDISELVAGFKTRRDMIHNGLLAAGYRVEKPGGAFYIFPKTPAGMTGTDFAVKCIENNVLLIPGNVFSLKDDRFRISYAAPIPKIKAGIEVLKKLNA